MPRRIEQINEVLRAELAEAVSREISLEGGLITVSYADCSPDLKQAKIGVSVLPDNLFGTALETLRKHERMLARILGGKIKIRRIPRLLWIADGREKNAAGLEKILRKIHDER